MKILVIGDVVGKRAVEYLSKNLWKYRSENKIDLVIANGENASDIHGISVAEADALLDAGADILTGGNHSFRRRDIHEYMENSDKIIRPANYPAGTPGSGYTTVDIDGWRVLVINVMGTTFMEPLACPFETVDKILSREEGRYDLSVLDIHAEATSEKIALGYYFDGKIGLVFGTHTHVATADETVLPRGTAYITDIGMSGPVDGVLGAKREEIFRKLKDKMPTQITVADGEIKAHGIITEINTSTKKAEYIKRITF